MTRRIASLVVIACAGLPGFAGYRMVGAEIESEVYRARLALLSQDYESLRERYGTLVRETAVTELVVRNGALSVSIRTAQGKPVSLPTQLDPSARSTGAGTRTRARLLARRACLSTACSPPDPERSSLVLPPL